jgi:general secretion pathway protein F
MAHYRFLVMDASRKKRICEIDARSEREAVEIIRQKKSLILKRVPDRSINVHQWLNWGAKSEILLFIKKLGVLLASSLPLNDSLLFLAKGAKYRWLRVLIQTLHQRISEGGALSQAMAEHPRLFPPTICAVVLAGEKSGHMDEALANLTQYLESQQEMRQSVQQAIVYPVILIIVSVIVITLLMAVAIPQIAEQLAQSNMPLPVSTKVVIAISQLLSDNGYILIAALLALLVLGNRLMHMRRLKLYWHQFLVTTPLIGPLNRKIQTFSVLMTLSILSRFSVPLLDAVRVSRGVIGNQWIKQNLDTAYHNINEGSTIYHALVNAKIMDTTTLTLLSAGEKSGEFHEMIGYATQILKKDIQSTLQMLIKLIEPALIFIIGFIVLFIFMSIMQPMLSLNNMVQ